MFDRKALLYKTREGEKGKGKKGRSGREGGRERTDGHCCVPDWKMQGSGRCTPFPTLCSRVLLQEAADLTTLIGTSLITQPNILTCRTLVTEP